VLLDEDDADLEGNERVDALVELTARAGAFLEAMVDRGQKLPTGVTAEAIRGDVERVLASESALMSPSKFSDSQVDRSAAMGFALLRRLACPVRSDGATESPDDLLEDWFLVDHLQQSWRRMGLGAAETDRAALALRAMVRCQGWWRDLGEEDGELAVFAGRLLVDPDVAALLGVNRYEGVDWFVAEGWDDLLHAMAVAFAVEETTGHEAAAAAATLERMADASKASGYRVDGLLEVLDEPVEPEKP